IHAAVRGRARYQVPGLYGSEALKSSLEFRLGACEGIQEVAASTRTGNVLVRFHPDISVEAVAALLGTVLAEHANAIRSRNGAPGDPASANGARSAKPLPVAGAAVAGRSPIQRAVVPAEAQREIPWHAMEAGAVAASLQTAQDTGLSNAAAQERLKRYGPNLPPEAVPRSGLSMLLEQFTSLPVALLGVAAGISLLSGGVADALVIASVVALNATIGYVTESQTEQTIHALTSVVRPSMQVLRDGVLCTVRSEEAVPGDVLILRPGSYVAADARVLTAERLSTDESTLTGESLAVDKPPAGRANANVPRADRHNMVYAGTLVSGGQGRAVVVATGRYTEMGLIQALVESAEPPETPLQQQLGTMGRQLVLLSSAVCGLVFGIGLLQGYGVLEMLKTAISLAVAAVPEGLPTVATTVLVRGVSNRRLHACLHRRLAAVETLGAVQTICLDKTGTL